MRAGQVSVVRPLVEARFPGTMEQLRQDEGGVSVEAARTATITQQEQDALAQSQAEASQAYAQHFQNLTPIDVTWCEQQAFPELCVDAAADLIEVRLRRAFERDPSVYTAFCNQQPMAMRKLAWVASPALDARVATLRSALCGGDGKPGSP